MAFIVTKRLQPDQQDVKLPVTLTFTATIRDDEAASPPASSTLTLRLAGQNNNLLFTPDGTKKKDFTRAIRSTDKEFSFIATIGGDPGSLLSFRVVLVLPDGQESGCLVNLK